MFCILLCIIIVFIIIVIGLLLRRTCNAKSYTLRIHRKMEGGGIVKYKHIRYLILVFSDAEGYYNEHHEDAHGLHDISQHPVTADFYYLRPPANPLWFMSASFIDLAPYKEVWGRDDSYYELKYIDDAFMPPDSVPNVMPPSSLKYGSRVVDIVSIADPNTYPNQGAVINIVNTRLEKLEASAFFKCKLSDKLVGEQHENDRIGYRIRERRIGGNIWIPNSDRRITEIAPADMHKYILISSGEKANYSRYRESTPGGTGRWESDLSKGHSDGNKMVFSHIPSGPMKQKPAIVGRIPAEARSIYDKSIDKSQYNIIFSDEVEMVRNGSYDRMLDELDAANIDEKEDVSSVFSLPQDGETISLPPMPSHHNLFSYLNRQDDRFLKYIVHNDFIQDKDYYFNWVPTIILPPNPEDEDADYRMRFRRILEFIGNFVLYDRSSTIQADRDKYNRIMKIHHITGLIQTSSVLLEALYEKIEEEKSTPHALLIRLNEAYVPLLEKTKEYISRIKPLLVEVADERRQLKDEYARSWRQIITNMKKLIIIDHDILPKINQIYQDVVDRAYAYVDDTEYRIPIAEQKVANLRSELQPLVHST